MTHDYKHKVLLRLDEVLDQMATAEPDDMRQLALAAKCLADIEQAARGGAADGGSLLDQMIKAAAANQNQTTTPAETKIPEHLKENETEQEND